MWLPAALYDPGSTQQEQLQGEPRVGSFLSLLCCSSKELLRTGCAVPCTWWPNTSAEALGGSPAFFLSFLDIQFLSSSNLTIYSLDVNILVAQLFSLKPNWYIKIAFTMHKTICIALAW